MHKKPAANFLAGRSPAFPSPVDAFSIECDDEKGNAVNFMLIVTRIEDKNTRNETAIKICPERIIKMMRRRTGR